MNENKQRHSFLIEKESIFSRIVLDVKGLGG